jgi:glucose-6-phosphate isomerase
MPKSTAADLPAAARPGPSTFTQSVDGCLVGAIGAHGLTGSDLAPWLAKASREIARLQDDHRLRRLELLGIADETADIEVARAALARLSQGARLIVFFGTGGSALGGQVLAQLAGWNIPGARAPDETKRPRTRFYDNLDGDTLAGALSEFDLETTRFVVTSKSGGTAETLAQAITALSAVKAAGLERRIPELFLGLTEPAQPGKSNGLRALFASLEIPMLDHATGIGGRFSGLTNCGLLPAMARGLDPYAIRAGAGHVIADLQTAKSTAEFAPALGAAVAVALSKERGIRTLVFMPYADRLGKLSEWFVQLWAESLGKGGEGTSPIAATGPLDQHSQLQLFMDGPREHYLTILRTATAGVGPVIDPGMAKTAGFAFAGGKTPGDIVAAQSHAVPEALARAGRPVRTIDIPVLDAPAIGALMMHFMLETIIAGRMLGLEPFDQPGVELAKVLTRERLST